MITAIARVDRDPQLLEEFKRIIKQPKMRAAFQAIWDLGPVTATDVDNTLKDGSLHTYFSKLAGAGWLIPHGRHQNRTNDRASMLWEISGEVGRVISDYKLRADKRRNQLSTAPIGAGRTVRIGRNVHQDIISAYKRFYAKRFIGIDDFIIQGFFRKLEIEFDILREVLEMESGRVLRQGGASPTRSKLRQACRTLKIPFPGDVTLARKKMRELSRIYHPDINPAGAEQFRLIIGAFETVESYAAARP